MVELKSLFYKSIDKELIDLKTVRWYLKNSLPFSATPRTFYSLDEEK